MSLIIEREDVWAASIKDECGGLAQILTGLQEAGVDLDFALARRAPDTPGTGVVFLTPLRSDAEIAAAAKLGFKVTSSVYSVRVEGENAPGIGAALTQELAAAGINLRGLSAAVLGGRFVMYVGLDSEEDAEKAVRVLEQV